MDRNIIFFIHLFPSIPTWSPKSSNISESLKRCYIMNNCSLFLCWRSILCFNSSYLGIGNVEERRSKFLRGKIDQWHLKNPPKTNFRNKKNQTVGQVSKALANSTVFWVSQCCLMLQCLLSMALFKIQAYLLRRQEKVFSILVKLFEVLLPHTKLRLTCQFLEIRHRRTCFLFGEKKKSKAA